MTKIEKGKLLLRERIEVMSKGENAQSERVLRDDELGAVSGGASGKHIEEVSIEF